jgi:hypothetical protein
MTPGPIPKITIEGIVNQLNKVEWTPDVVVLDYLSVMKPARSCTPPVEPVHTDEGEIE